jgi:hypothetical protein
MVRLITNPTRRSVKNRWLGQVSFYTSVPSGLRRFMINVSLTKGPKTDGHGKAHEINTDR